MWKDSPFNNEWFGFAKAKNILPEDLLKFQTLRVEKNLREFPGSLFK